MNTKLCFSLEHENVIKSSNVDNIIFTTPHNFTKFWSTRELTILRLIFPVFHEFTTLFQSKVSQFRLCFGQRLVIFYGFKIVNVFWKMSDVDNFAPTNHSPNNRLFLEFLVKLSGLLFIKKLFSLLKCFNFLREPEPPSDSGILRPRRGSSFPPFFDKNISKTHTFCWFRWQKIWRKFFENSEFSFKNQVPIPRKSIFLKGFRITF